MFIFAPTGETAFFELVGIMLCFYFILLIITILKMIWTLHPLNISKPLSKNWNGIGWILLISGYIPGILCCRYGYSHGWNIYDLLLIPVFVGPFLIFILTSIKKRHIKQVIIRPPSSTISKKSDEDLYDDDYYYPDQK